MKVCKEKIPEDVVFDMSLLTTDKVMEYLNNLDNSKSIGTDGIGPRLLRMASPIIAESLAFICNLRIKTLSIPDKWKEAKVNHCIKEDHLMTLILLDQSNKISNDQELMQSDPTSCPQNQKGNN